MAQVLQPEVHCSSAKEFLDKLSPMGEYFKEAELREPWLFRGQGKDLPLIPSAFRNDSRRFASLTNRNIQDYGQRLSAERDILSQFFDVADKRGLVLPDDSQELRSTLETLKSERGDSNVSKGDDEWQMYENALSLMALAQHYGIPTRLLDWTRQPFIAAFFAAESAINQNSDMDGHFALDRMKGLLGVLTYSRSDQRSGVSARHRIPIDGDAVNGTASLRNAANLYRLFCEDCPPNTKRSV